MRVSCTIYLALVALSHASVPSGHRRGRGLVTRNAQFEPATTEAFQPSSTDDVSQVGNCFSVDGVGTFATVRTYDFTTPGELSSDFQISDYSVPDQAAGVPWNHGFKLSNVYMADGFLNIRVPGGQDPATDPAKAIWGGEIYTAEANILYASVRTEAMFDATPGTCQGIFSYRDDTSEIDIEYMSNSSSKANPSPSEPAVFWYTNQPGGTPENQATGPTPPDVASVVHEYRIDWTADQTAFYVDGVLQKTLEADVPSNGSQWVWNNWANGDPEWSCGPPETDNVLKIQSITMYYNTTESAACNDE